MIPSITPPTDNLYKFISLFGLTIFLFASYNLGIVYDQSASSKMRIEDLKVVVQKKLLEKELVIPEEVKTDELKRRFKLAKIGVMSKDLDRISRVVKYSPLKKVTIIDLIGKITKVKIKVDALLLKEAICFFFAILGFGIMLRGFFLWKKREQNIRDKILTIEHAIKLYERDKEKNKHLAH